MKRFFLWLGQWLFVSKTPEEYYKPKPEREDIQAAIVLVLVLILCMSLIGGYE